MKSILAVILLLVVSSAHAGTKTPAKPKFSKLNTNHNFEDMTVRGKYMYPDEAVAQVEDEKGLTDLLGVRMNFKDRIIKNSARQ